MNGSFIHSLEMHNHFGAETLICAQLDIYLGTLLVGLKPHSYGQEL